MVAANFKYLLQHTAAHTTVMRLKYAGWTTDHFHFSFKVWAPLKKKNKLSKELQPCEPNSIYLLTYSMEQIPSWKANWFCS